MEMQQFSLWQRTLAPQGDGLDPQRSFLSNAFVEFRDRVKHLVSEIGAILPELTVHDITHLDALWRVADQVAGPEYPLNPAEAFVLGGAFLLHDAAHVLAAYENRLSGVKQSIEWKDLIAHRFRNIEPDSGSADEKSALFQVLRELHALQARKLPKLSWKIPGSTEAVSLIPNFKLREYYGDLIGQISESHHWPAHRVSDTFIDLIVNAPGFLTPATWAVDTLKVALLLRTADAAHVDGQRAPWFLFALRQPTGISNDHWKFQAKMGQPTLTPAGELRLTSGSPFELAERHAWWLAYDTARLIDRELRDAQLLLRDSGRTPFAATAVAHVATPRSFSSDVRTSGWEPVNVEATIGNVPKVINNFGGANLYGDKPELALRELLQNAADAIHALRTLNELGPEEGSIEVVLSRFGDKCELSVTDNGIGMSRYVLTEVLPDFGNSLWSGEAVRGELPGLISSGFKPIGQFGIGFYSTFILGDHVKVTTRRFRRRAEDESEQWVLVFENRIFGRPTLRRPVPNEELRKNGTRVSIDINETVLKKLCNGYGDVWEIAGLPRFGKISDEQAMLSADKRIPYDFTQIVASLCPTLDIDVYVRVGSSAARKAVSANDWPTIEAGTLLARLNAHYRIGNRGVTRLGDLKETDGKLVGRIAYNSDYFARAWITYGGIQTGHLPKLAGVVLGLNNNDLARSESTASVSLNAWKIWAEQWLDANPEATDAIVDLHPLCSERDLPVFKIGEQSINRQSLENWLLSKNTVQVHAGVPEYQDDDDVSKTKFDKYLVAADDVIFYPSRESLLAKALKIERIDYLELMQVLLSKSWTNFEEREIEDQIVGNVDGIEIRRKVTVFSRQPTI